MVSQLEHLTHAIDQLRQSLGGWDPLAFVSTLVATLAGAAVGLVPVFIERRAAYRTRLDESLGRVIQAAHRAADESDEWSRKVGEEEEMLIRGNVGSPDAWDAVGSTLTTPREGDLDAALQVALLTSRRGDRDVVQGVVAAFGVASELPPYKRAAAFKERTAFITKWRTGALSPDKRQALLSSLNLVHGESRS